MARCSMDRCQTFFIFLTKLTHGSCSPLDPISGLIVPFALPFQPVRIHFQKQFFELRSLLRREDLPDSIPALLTGLVILGIVSLMYFRVARACVAQDRLDRFLLIRG